MWFRSYRVRHEFPLRAAYFRQVLTQVHGFPMFGVLCRIRHPNRIRPFGLPVHSLFNHSTRVQSGFREPVPFVSLTQSASWSNFGQERMGLPEFSDVSLPACHGLRTPADLHTLALTGASVLPSVNVKTLGVRVLLFRSGTSTSGSATSPTACGIRTLPSFTVRRLPRSASNTRYGWVASPYPTGTFTLQDTPSFVSAR